MCLCPALAGWLVLEGEGAEADRNEPGAYSLPANGHDAATALLVCVPVRITDVCTGAGRARLYTAATLPQAHALSVGAMFE